MSDRVLCITDAQWAGGALRTVLACPEWTLVVAPMAESSASLGAQWPDAVVLALHDARDAARQIVEQIRQQDEYIPIIVLLSRADQVPVAVELMRAGVHDVLVSPAEDDRIVRSIQRAQTMARLARRVFQLEQQVGVTSGHLDNMVGHSPLMQEIFQVITTVAPSNATVLITGESGTGKELVARALHRHSQRARYRFMDLNCGAIPPNLLENELFGHERGAYTGADRRYIGCCERAHQGTLFLDEICEMSPTLQVKLLRLLQERTLMRVGGNEMITVDIRFVAATNRTLQDEVAKGNFREDLFYRLNVVPIHLPPLRDRPQDIGPLAYHFLEKFARKLEKPFVDIASDALQKLLEYRWPGNIRELENTMERAVVLSNDTRLRIKHLPAQIAECVVQTSARLVVDAAGRSDPAAVIPLELVEKYTIAAALEKCVGNVGEAARRLKIGQATLYRKIKLYGLRA